MKNNSAIFRLPLLLMFLLLLAAFLATGCAMVGKAPIKISYYDPVAIPSSYIVTGEGEVKELTYKNDKYEISLALISAANIFASNIEIKNKTKKEILPNEYLIRLYDGRDRIELPSISKEVVVVYRAKVSAGQDIKTGNSILDYSLNSFTGIMETAATPINKNQYSSYIGMVIDHYFSYRPIYPGFTRKGILCFFNRIIPEYPLILVIKIKEDTYEFKFWPVGMAPENTDSNFPDYNF
ncbi:MAG: hypothetical protein NT099_09435 [Candidatus Saganbacteria bacterium]|nr:hypothetical protein [Candidatus Saganbacteria bacterium]